MEETYLLMVSLIRGEGGDYIYKPAIMETAYSGQIEELRSVMNFNILKNVDEDGNRLPNDHQFRFIGTYLGLCLMVLDLDSSKLVNPSSDETDEEVLRSNFIAQSNYIKSIIDPLIDKNQIGPYDLVWSAIKIEGDQTQYGLQHYLNAVPPQTVPMIDMMGNGVTGWP